MLKGVWLHDVSKFQFQTFEEYGTLYQMCIETAFDKYNQQIADGTAGLKSHLLSIGDGFVIDMKDMVEFSITDSKIPKRQVKRLDASSCKR